MPSPRPWIRTAGHLLAAFALVLASGCASTVEPSLPAEPGQAEPAPDPHTWPVKTFALLVGTGTYQPGWKPLPGAIRDVQEVARALEKNGVQTEVFTDLTRERFDRVLADFFFRYGAAEDHHLLVYIAGHGNTEELITGELLGSLILSDTPRPDQDLAGFRLRSVPMWAFEEISPKVRARQVLFMFDVCFSGSLFTGAAAPSPPGTDAEVHRRLALPVRQFITSGNQTDAVPDYSQFKQIFVNFLTVEGAEPHRDGYLTGSEIGAYLAAELPRRANPQHPQYGTLRDNKLNQGDFVLRLDPSIAPPPPGTLVPVVFLTNRRGATIKIDRVKLGQTLQRRQVAGTEGYVLETRLLPGQRYLEAVNYWSADRPVEQMLQVANVWTQQVIQLEFVGAPPAPPP